MQARTSKKSVASRRLMMALAMSLALPAAAADTRGTGELAPRLLPRKGLHDLRADVAIPRVVVKFHEGTHVRVRDGRLSQFAAERSAREGNQLTARGLSAFQVQSDVDALVRLAGDEPRALGMDRLFKAEERLLDARRSEGELRGGQELADLNLYVELPMRAGTTFADVQALVARLDALPSVETAYAEPVTEPAALTGPTTAAPFSFSAVGNLQGSQGYLGAAPNGVEALYAWTVAGGTAAGVNIVDVEGAWRTTHEDLPAFFHMGGTQFNDPAWRNHGTAVMGEMVGRNNGVGVTGIAHGASPGFEAIGAQSAASAIANAAVAAGPGNVVLIELHRQGPADATPCTCNFGQCNYIAMEYWQAEFDAISQATLNGTSVVEAAGNGSVNMDDPAYGGLFNRDTRDSGAIVVAAGSANGRVPMCWTNFGGRPDVNGWGENVVSTGYGDLYNGGTEDSWYTGTFSGTSSASPIVTGTVAVIQGALRGHGRFPLSPLALRDVLSSTGSAQAADARRIGNRPNLRAALTRLNLF
ncbi:peptidase S8 [Corallococcus sp. H22C18031201]|uniref:S8 family serine peptidase n=1 Tax=Citreicoccus inhibens TaxID=2849499 RepID=UPI000E733B74|nr:S8 family serine peptidase [Citreicoccus inhibens]MBU8898126.1 S8 family serine peptidase [Citreicoccus inhibens]RJS18011.1 peptidase S8 [Corallococcus sp. H22C18031201]